MSGEDSLNGNAMDGVSEVEVTSIEAPAPAAPAPIDDEVPDTDLNVSVSETSKGGIKYEIILGEPKCTSPPRVASPAVFLTKPTPELSVELLQKKILAATERRQSLEAERVAAATEKWRKVEEAAKKREDEINRIKENLEQSMETHTGNREKLLSDLKSKLQNHHNNHVKEVRQNLEKSFNDQEEKIKGDLITKLEIAEKNREKALQEKLDSLKKHDEKVELIRSRSLNKINSSIDGGEDVPAETESASAN